MRQGRVRVFHVAERGGSRENLTSYDAIANRAGRFAGCAGRPQEWGRGTQECVRHGKLAERSQSEGGRGWRMGFAERTQFGVKWLQLQWVAGGGVAGRAGVRRGGAPIHGGWRGRNVRWNPSGAGGGRRFCRVA